MNATADAVFERFRGHEQDPDAQDRLWAQLAGTVLAEPDVPFHEHWRLYDSVFAERPPEAGPPRAWVPSKTVLDHAHLTALIRDVGVADYPALHAWSVADRAGYWGKAIYALGIPFFEPPSRILDDTGGPEDPKWLPGARLNAAQMCFQADPRKTALITAGEGRSTTRWTYGELHALADRVSHGLVAQGLGRGDSVALYLPMTAECVAAYLGIVQAGMAVVSIPDSFAAPEVATRLRLGDAKAVITVDTFRRGGKEVPMAPKARQAATSLDGDVPVIVIGAADEAAGDVAWETLVGTTVGADAVSSSGDAFDAVPCDPDDTTNVLFSSGTTGEPKAIAWTHLTPIKGAADGRFHQDIHADDVVAWPTNIGWMMGPWLIYATLANQATMALYEGVPTSDGFLDFCNEAKVTMLGVVPAVVRAWKEAGVPPHRLETVRVFSSTGEASNAQDYLYLMSLASYRAPVIEYCGGTEVGGGHITGSVVQPGSPGTFTTPALGIDFHILGEDGKPVPDGEHGELYLVPPSIGLSQRLLNRDHHETYFAGCPQGPDGEVLRRHGDQVERLAPWWWRPQGRADDTMNLGGIKVGSIELENAMNGHPAVSETAAVGIPPAGGGAERLVVFVVPVASPDAGGATSGKSPDLRKELQDRIKERLNPLFRIHDVVVVDALPRTASNKVMRRRLRATYEEDA